MREIRAIYNNNNTSRENHDKEQISASADKLSDEIAGDKNDGV